MAVKRIVRYIGGFCIFIFTAIHVNAQEVPQKNYYVVIGMFDKLADAQRLTDEANVKSFNAHYAWQDKKKKYYVYLLHTSDQKKAKSFLNKIQKETEYKKARLYQGKLGDVK